MTFPNLDRIDGVYNYCDSWCEKCAFTTRCSIFAVEVAMAMCGGDHEAGLELAIGHPPPTPEEERRREQLVAAANACVPDDAEVEQYSRQEEARRERIEETRAITACTQAALLMSTWLNSRGEPDPSEPLRISDALAVARWDQHLIPVKLRRALRGLDERTRGESFEDDPVQNDWNGTAKLTLICIRRSIDAWDTLAGELRDPEAKAVSEHLRELQREVERTFPDADRFVRPGFDDEPQRTDT